MSLWVLLVAVLFAGSLLTASPGKTETIQTAMRDAVLHEDNQISLLGWKNVNPGLISAMTVSAVLLIAAACIRIFVIPRFQMVPGRFQMLLEQAVNGIPCRCAGFEGTDSAFAFLRRCFDGLS